MNTSIKMYKLLIPYTWETFEPKIFRSEGGHDDHFAISPSGLFYYFL
jgi:hypothetical protein